MTGPTRRLGPRAAALVVATALLGTACSSGGDDATPAAPDGAGPDTTATPTEDWTYPGDNWATEAPAEAGFDPDALDELAGQAEAANSSCLVVTRDGAVVDERYWAGADAETPREAFSVTKSITSVLVGLAQDDGQLSLDDPAADHIPAWQGTPAEDVTVRNLLSNDSGREWSLGLDYSQLILSPDKTGFAVGLDQEHRPGEVWAYNNSAIQTLDDVLAEATGQEPAAFAQSRLFAPIGMDHTEMVTDNAGNTITFMGLQTTCLDLARFGYLMLREGTWDGERVLSPEYAAEATGRSSTEMNAGYGYLFWLNRRGNLTTPLIATSGAPEGESPDAQTTPGAPEDVYWALGFQNQIVAVIPSEGIVAVRMGDDPGTGGPFTQSELTLGVLEALTG